MKWKKKIQAVLWCLLALSTIVLLVAAVQKKESLLCTDIRIEIEGAQEHVFVDEKQVLQILSKAGVVKGKPMSAIHLRSLEQAVRKDAWIKEAELFFDNNQVLQVNIVEREPLARVFTLQGNSFYIDSSGMRLPLSDKLSARVPVFTSFPGDRVRLSGPDSAVLKDIKLLARAIDGNPFWIELVSQVDITPQRTYQLIPQLGNQVIELGNAEDLDDKLNRLFSFYKQVWAKTGFEKYEKIDVQYAGQVVAIRRGEGKPVVDSALAMQQLNNSIVMAGGILPADTMRQPAAVAPAAVRRDTATVSRRTVSTAPKPAQVRSGNRRTQAGPKPKPKPANSGRQPRAVMPVRH
jgi:cell division protein FtsQ